ncbi:MAG: SDR family NAD(P)-dependent oxidoreductase [Wenzhouxiangella sp.]|jgi:NAD(P)-dependent dehydrogenase (short-subunit alcohol dehydrogenase family)|nr:SDR family NAD(P)-dependent oxidoreductase [Wenzhouxiangella sp.]
MNPRIDGSIWLVTGAAGGLGRALVAALLGQGCDCIALDRNLRGLNQLHDELAAAGRPPALYPLDMTGAGPDDYAALAEQITDQFGGLTGVIHAAAHFEALRPLGHQSAEEWFKTLQAGLTGPQFLNVALMPMLREVDGGIIVFVNNAQCLDRPARWGAYGISQAGRRQMVQTLSAELGPRGPCVLEVDPGPFFSPLRSAAWPTDDPGDLPSAEAAAEEILRQITTGRMQQ